MFKKAYDAVTSKVGKTVMGLGILGMGLGVMGANASEVIRTIYIDTFNSAAYTQSGAQPMSIEQKAKARSDWDSHYITIKDDTLEYRIGSPDSDPIETTFLPSREEDPKGIERQKVIDEYIDLAEDLGGVEVKAKTVKATSDLPTQVYGNVYDLISGNPVTDGTCRYFNEEGDINETTTLGNDGFFLFTPEYDPLNFNKLVIQTPQDMMNVTDRGAGAGLSPLRYDVGPTDDGNPFYFYPGLATDMMEGRARWELPVHVYFGDNPTPEQLENIQSAMDRFNELWADQISPMNDYISANGLDRPTLPETFFVRRDYFQNSNLATNFNMATHQGCNLTFHPGDELVGIVENGDRQIVFATLNYGSGSMEHAFGHIAGAYHTGNNGIDYPPGIASGMSPSAGTLTKDDMRVFAAFYAWPFDKVNIRNIRFLTTENVDIGTPVLNWMMY